MSKANLLKTETKSFQDLLGNGKVFEVPKFQRDYSWKEEHWEDLWADILALNLARDSRHYMGAIVVEGASDRKFRIIDGQQRVATLSILALAVIARLQDLAAEGVEANENKERAVRLRARFIGEKDPASLTEASKLSLNATDDSFYQGNLIQLRPPINPRKLPKSNRQLWSCFVYFGKRLQDPGSGLSSGLQLAELLSEVVAHQLLFILITVDDQMNAYTVFETLNARGLELSATDLLKNYLFSRIQSEPDLKMLQSNWQDLIATVQQEHFPEFLRYDLLCVLPQVRQQRLFKIVRDKVSTPGQVFELMDRLERRAETFAAATDPDHGYWQDFPGNEPQVLVAELKLFRVRQHIPALFAAWEKWPNSPELVKLLTHLRSFFFRYTVIASLNPNELEPRFHEIAAGVLSGKFATARQAFAPLRKLYPTDQTFSDDLSQKSFWTKGQRRKLTKYVLCKLEQESSGKTCDFRTDPGTIEHILPEHPDASWESSIAAEHQDDAVLRLGNLTLFEGKKNRGLGNSSYEEKLAVYEQSSYQLTRSIAQSPVDDWSMAAIEARQRQLAKLATQIWRVD